MKKWNVLKMILFVLLFSIYFPFTANATQSNNTGITEQSTEMTAEEVQTVTLRISSAKATSVTLKWSKVNNTKKYYIYRSTKKKSGYKKIAAVNKTKYTDKKISEKKTYYYKIKAALTDGSSLMSNTKVKVKVKGDYKIGSIYGSSLSNSQLRKVKDYVANFVNVYTEPGMDDFIKVYYAHNYLCNTCSYEYRGWNVNHANTALGALKYKKAQCSGYARAFKALCDGMGIGCKYVHANSKAMNPSHQWNIVRVDKKWYLIDVQGNDSSGFYMCFLVGSTNNKKYFGNVYKYNTKGMPKLSKKDYDMSKYFD